MSNIHIEPSDHEIHFWLNDETPEFGITLTQVGERGPLIYRVGRIGSGAKEDLTCRHGNTEVLIFSCCLLCLL